MIRRKTTRKRKPTIKAGDYSHMGCTDLIDRAISAYCKRPGAQQPARDSTRVEKDVIILGNVNGELARYRIQGWLGSERLRRVTEEELASDED